MTNKRKWERNQSMSAQKVNRIQQKIAREERGGDKIAIRQTENNEQNVKVSTSLSVITSNVV